MNRFTLLAFALLLVICHPFTALATSPASVPSFAHRAQNGENLTIVFFGGSLTWGANASDPLTTSWRGRMMRYLVEKFPHAHFTFHDAAIGGTGSMLGLYRLQRDVLSHKPDLVFLEFTMNDGAEGSDAQTSAAYEYLLRKLLKSGCAVQPVITTFKFFVNAPSELPRVTDHRRLFQDYHLVQADIHQAIQDAVQARQADPDILWPLDGAHPDDPGYEWFFNIVRDQFERNITEKREPRIPEKTTFPELYKKITRNILVNSPLPQGWIREKTRRTALWFDGLSSRWMGDVAAAKVRGGAKPEPLEVSFEGTVVGLFGERDSISVPFKAWIDGEPIAVPSRKGAKNPEPQYVWQTNTSKMVPAQAGTGNLFSWILLSKDLKPGKHILRIEPIWEEADKNAELRIESVCSAGP